MSSIADSHPPPGSERDSTVRQPRTAWAWAFATFFGIGYLKPGPGTWGSVAALLTWLAAALLPYSRPSGWHLAFGTALAAAAALAVGIPVATIVERQSAGPDGMASDPQFIVLDEVVGQWIALIGITADWKHAVVSLVLFRAFDITKPPPARQFDRMHGGFGIMMDDVAAGVYALLLGHLLRSHVLTRWF